MFKYVCLLLLSLITLRTTRGFRTLSVHERSIENNLLLKITVDNVSAALKLLLFFLRLHRLLCQQFILF